MRSNTRFSAKITAPAILAILALALFGLPTLAAAREKLAVTDCIKCHETEPATIESKGGKHKTAVTCLDCHEEHPPWGKDVIPVCSKCHSGKSHYQLENCLGCHSDPHKPLDLNLKGDITGPCLTCHPQQGKELQEHPSKHTQQSCTFCHHRHGLIPECFECHKPHAEGQTMTDCLGCHPVHQPLQISYPLTTSRSFCIPCHEEEGKLMAQTTTKHQAFTCAFCHRQTHPSVPQCQTCHGEPHSPEMHKKHPNCLDCHIDPHYLQK